MTVIWHAEIDDKEIVLSQNGRYLEFTKRNSPIIYKYDLADHTLLCYTRATGEPRTRHRGETNRSDYIKFTAEKCGELLGISAEEFCEITYNNACRFYGIDCD